MVFEQILLVGIFFLLFSLLLWGKFRYDLVAFSVLISSVAIGVVPYKNAFDGFAHPATIIVALVLIVSKGLINSGAIFFIGQKISTFGKSLWGHISIIGFIGAILSAFMNNVAALALRGIPQLWHPRCVGSTWSESWSERAAGGQLVAKG